MSHEIIPIQEWMHTFRGAADDLARTSLRFDPAAPASRSPEPGEPGAYIAIVGSPGTELEFAL